MYACMHVKMYVYKNLCTYIAICVCYLFVYIHAGSYIARYVFAWTRNACVCM